MLTDKRKIIISTGNILNVNKKAGQKTHEEVSQLHISHICFSRTQLCQTVRSEYLAQFVASAHSQVGLFSVCIFPNKIPFMHHLERERERESYKN